MMQEPRRRRKSVSPQAANVGLGRGNFQQLAGKSSGNGAGARELTAPWPVFPFLSLPCLAAVGGNVRCPAASETLASFALSGSTLRTIRASRWHQHEIETLSKTGNALALPNLRRNMPERAGGVKRVMIAAKLEQTQWGGPRKLDANLHVASS